MSGVSSGAGGGSSQLTALQAAIDAAGLGVNQSWQDLTGGRLVATNYLNSSGKAIMVAIQLSTSVSSYLSVDGVNTGRPAGDGNNHQVVAIVPNGSTYRMDSGSVQLWSELR